jgi:hypothetical protein
MFLGWSRRNSSRQVNLAHTISRAIFMPPPVDPADAPINMQTNRITWLSPVTEIQADHQRDEQDERQHQQKNTDNA